MIRVLLDILPPLLLPTLLWVARLSWKQKRDGGTLVPDWQLVPWSWLLIIGGALALMVLFGGAFLDDTATGRYHPAQLDQQGRLVPGGFK
ncbi:MAG TPA: hypothetical protein VM661_02380 [Candidatus Sulfotelmatobacter sp.]|jgi:hypothetical protein|nr:hypothetical protein [Candidatus Sulfotelmatobacter sp.]